MPGLDLHLIEARSGFGDRLIESGTADIAIQLVNPEEMEGEALIWETPFWITPRADFPESVPVALETVLKTRMILPSPGNPLGRCLQVEAEARGLKLEVRARWTGRTRGDRRFWRGWEPRCSARTA